MHSFALNYIGNICFSEKIEKINGAASSRLNEARERDDNLQLQHRSRGSAPTVPSSGRAARVQHVHCPCVAASPCCFPSHPAWRGLRLLLRCSHESNAPQIFPCVLSRALQAMLETPLQVPLPLSPPERIDATGLMK
jgi:hypothetical protein